jgi:hypothetical protein
MMNALVVQTQGVLNDPGPMQRMLEEQQVSLTVQLANAQQQLRESQMNFELTGGADKAAARALVVQNGVRVAAIRDRLGTIRDRIASAQDALRSAPVGVAVAGEQQRIFTLTPTEFYSAAGLLLLLPLVLAFARRIWRGSPVRSRGDHPLEGSPQIARLEQAVEAIAIEVERISEAQRFSAKLLSERAVEPVSEPSPRRAKRPVITPLP